MKIKALVVLIAISTSVMAQDRKIDVESKVVTTHEVTIKGKRVPYSATVGTQPVWDGNGDPIATLFWFCFCLDALGLYWPAYS